MRSRIARLERILRYRARLERLAEGELATAKRVSGERRARLVAAESARRALLAEGGPARTGEVDPVLMETELVYARLLGRRIESRRGALRAAEREESVRLEALLERRRARRALELLIERREERERRLRDRREKARLDEVASSRWWRAHSEEVDHADLR